MVDTGLTNGRAKVKHQRREDPGTEGAEGVVRATGEGSGKVAVPLPEKNV